MELRLQGKNGVCGKTVRADAPQVKVSGSFASIRTTASEDRREGEQGFLLVGVIVLVALVLLALSVAAPIVAKDLRRERELEAVHRGQQYVRAVRLYYKKNNTYPVSVKVLEGGQPLERFLRKHYLDPMTGKDDWRLIGLGQAKTTVKGFFGEPLQGIASQGLGSASGLQSGGLQGSTGGVAGGSASAFGNTSVGTGTGGTVGTGGNGGDSGTQTGGTGSTGSTGGSGAGSGFGTSSFGQSGTGLNGTGTNGSGSTGTGSDSAFGSGSTGPFVGIGIPKDGASIVVLNEQTDYSKWEFIYDPRIEQLYAKSSIFGGGIATSSGGLGSASGLSSTPGTGSGTSGFGSSSFGTPGSGTNNGNPGGTGSGNTGTGGSTNPNPNAPTPQ